MNIDAGKGIGIGETTFNSDPLIVANVTRPAAIDLRKENLATQLADLKVFMKRI